MKLNIAITAFALLFAQIAHSEANYYTVRLKNVFVGEFTFEHEFTEDKYRAYIAAETIGFAKAVILASFEGEASGTGTQYRQYFPEMANMDIRTPDYQNRIELAFSENKISQFSNELDEESVVDFSQLENPVDPVTAFAYVFRPIDYDHLCAMRVNIVDGLRLRRLVLNEPEMRQDGRWQCRGAIERVEGYSEGELAETEFYQLTAVYQRKTESELYLDRMLVETPWGEVEIAYEYEISAGSSVPAEDETDASEPASEGVE